MSVFDEIDRAYQEFTERMTNTRQAIRELGGACVRADELGNWTCTYRPTKGDRYRQRLVARSPAELIEQLKNAPDRPGSTK